MHICNIRRMLLLILAFMLAFTGAASAASTVFIMEDTAVYAKPDEDSKVYGMLAAGKKYTMVDSGYGWAKLQAGNAMSGILLQRFGIMEKGLFIWTVNLPEKKRYPICPENLFVSVPVDYIRQNGRENRGIQQLMSLKFMTGLYPQMKSLLNTKPESGKTEIISGKKSKK